MPERQVHDCAWSIAWATLELIRPLIREEEHRDFVDEAYAVARKEIERYEQAKTRQEQRLKPVD